MPQEWYLMSEGVVKGPVSAKQLRALAEAGRLSPVDRVRRNEGQWVEASHVKGLFELGEAMPSNDYPVDSHAEGNGEVPNGSYQVAALRK